MSEVNTEVMKIDGKPIVTVDIKIDRPMKGGVIEFKGEPDPIIVATSAGAIYENRILAFKEKRFMVYLEYPYDNKDIICTLSYVENDKIVDHETFDIPIQKRDRPPVTKKGSTIQTDGESYKSRLEEFQKLLTQSKICAKVEAKEDIIVIFDEPIKNSNWYAFGQISNRIQISDFVTKVLPGQFKVIIPIEVFWQQYSKYKAGVQLGFFEIVKADFLTAANVYYKRLISNTLSLSDFPKKQLQPATVFSPLGERIEINQS